MSIEVRRLANIGAEVIGVDLASQPSASLRQHLNALWLEHAVLLFRDQSIGPKEQIAFSRVFGEVEAHLLKAIRSRDYPEMMVLTAADELRNPVAYFDGEPVVGQLPWHKDLIYTSSPNRGALLKAVEVPAHEGRTGFGDQGVAYDALPDDMKAKIADLEIVNRFCVFAPSAPFFDMTGYQPSDAAPRTPKEAGFQDFPDVAYPLVLEHPINRRKILNISILNLMRVEGLPPAESDALLKQLVAHVTREQFTYIHQWRAGDVVMWDNWRCMHKTTGTRPGDARMIHRTTIKGGLKLGRELQDVA